MILVSVLDREAGERNWRMQGETGEHWRELCEQAAKEQDPTRLMDLVTEINRMLAEKEQRLRREHEQPTDQPAMPKETAV